MKHTIRQHGQLTQIDCELGSGLKDKNGVEIIEGDRVLQSDGNCLVVTFKHGVLGLDGICTMGDFPATIHSPIHDDLEVVGHVEEV